MLYFENIPCHWYYQGRYTTRRGQADAEIRWQKPRMCRERLCRRVEMDAGKNIVRGSSDALIGWRWQRVTTDAVFADMVNTLALGNCRCLVATSQIGYCRCCQVCLRTWTTDATSADLTMPRRQKDQLQRIICVVKSLL